MSQITNARTSEWRGECRAARRAERMQRGSVPIVPIVIGAIAVLALVAIFLSMSSSDSKDNEGGAMEYGTVVVEGVDLVPLPDDGPDPAKGKLAPTIEGTNFSGEPTVIAPGPARAIVFLAHWCPHCNAEAPRLVDFLENEGIPDGTALTIVTTSSKKDAPNWPPSKWVKKVGLGAVETLVDDKSGSAAMAMGVNSFPFVVLLDADGNVIDRDSGEQPEEYFAEAFALLLEKSST